MGKGMLWVMGAMVLGTSAAFAEGPTFELTPFVGYSHLDVDRSIMRDGGNKRVENVEIGARFGVHVPGGLLLEVGGAEVPNAIIDNWFDEVTMNHIEGAIGWQIDSASGFRFTPKVGRMRWELDGVGKAFVNSAGEFHRTYYGYDYFYEASFMYQVKPKVALGLTLRAVDSDIIDARQGSFGIQISF